MRSRLQALLLICVLLVVWLLIGRTTAPRDSAPVADPGPPVRVAAPVACEEDASRPAPLPTERATVPQIPRALRIEGDLRNIRLTEVAFSHGDLQRFSVRLCVELPHEVHSLGGLSVRRAVTDSDQSLSLSAEGHCDLANNSKKHALLTIDLESPEKRAEYVTELSGELEYVFPGEPFVKEAGRLTLADLPTYNLEQAFSLPRGKAFAVHGYHHMLEDGSLDGLLYTQVWHGASDTVDSIWLATEDGKKINTRRAGTMRQGKTATMVAHEIRGEKPAVVNVIMEGRSGCARAALPFLIRNIPINGGPDMRPGVPPSWEERLAARAAPGRPFNADSVF